MSDVPTIDWVKLAPLFKMDERQRHAFEVLTTHMKGQVLRCGTVDSGEVIVDLILPRDEATIWKVQVLADGEMWLYFGDYADPSLEVKLVRGPR